MEKIIGLALTILFALNISIAAQERFPQLDKIEGYEVRPGIVFIPRYTVTGEVCEAGIERLRYTPALIRLNSLSREEISQALEEVIPANQRGKLLKDNDDLITQVGPSVSMTTTTEYENVVIRVYQIPFPTGKNQKAFSPIIATVTWKGRQCR